MLTLITGTPGAGKSLYAVSMIAQHVPGSTVENGQTPVKRVLYSNVRDLLVEHEIITADDLNSWQTWAKPGAVILFDEVQEVWRARGTSTKVPDCIAALETHRHLGVDIILVTQHPMLLDQNIRRLVNQHLHLRRLTKTIAMVYEWDHCSNPGTTKTCISAKVWRHPKAAYKLYKSAQLHTKPTSRVPPILYVGLLALAGLAYAGPMAYGRITNTFSGKPVTPVVAESGTKNSPSSVIREGFTVTTETTTQAGPQGVVVPEVAGSAPVAALAFVGCIASASRCGCFDASGGAVDSPRDVCEKVAGVGKGKPVAFPDSLNARLMPDESGLHF
jgi:zona occludens toxin